MIYGDGVSLDALVREAEGELRRVHGEMIALARELRPELSLGAALEELRRQHPSTEAELLGAYEEVQKRVDDTLTRRLGLPAGAARYVQPAGVPVSPATNWPAPLLDVAYRDTLAQFVSTPPGGGSLREDGRGACGHDQQGVAAQDSRGRRGRDVSQRGWPASAALRRTRKFAHPRPRYQVSD